MFLLMQYVEQCSLLSAYSLYKNEIRNNNN